MAAQRFPQQPQVRCSNAVRPPNQRDLPLRRVVAEGYYRQSGFTPGFDLDGKTRDQGQAETARHHLQQRAQARRLQILVRLTGLQPARGERMVAQAVSVLQQQQPLIRQFAAVDRRALGEAVMFRTGDQQRIIAQHHLLQTVGGVGQRDHRAVQPAASEQLNQPRRLLFAQVEAEVRVRPAQDRQDSRQQVGCDGRDDTQPQQPAQRLSPRLCGVHQFVGVAQQGASPLDDILADGGQRRLPLAAAHQLHPQQVFQFAQPGAQGRLGHQTILGGAPEVPVLGDGDEIL